ncbi:MAG: hypothetical protein R3B57_03460 [Phycisphaerales bacterium]
MTRSATQTNDHASLSDVKSDVATLKSDVADLVAGLARDGRHSAGEGIHAAGEKLGEVAQHTKATAKMAHTKLSDSVSERPITYLALAFGAGAIAAKLLSR